MNTSAWVGLGTQISPVGLKERTCLRRCRRYFEEGKEVSDYDRLFHILKSLNFVMETFGIQQKILNKEVAPLDVCFRTNSLEALRRRGRKRKEGS